MPPKTPRPIITKKGSGLKRKIGPLPLWAWVGALVVVAYYLYHRSKANQTPAQTANSSTGYVPQTTVTPQQAASGSNPNPSTGDVSAPVNDPFILPSDYVNQTDLNSQLDSLGSNVAAQIAAATFATQTPATQPSVTLPATSTKPKTAPQKSNPVVHKPAPIAPKKLVYYTYKKNVKLMKGQSIHFSTGHGYYAA